MTQNKRLLSWLLGATALAALTYTATRRSLQRRAPDDSGAAVTHPTGVQSDPELAGQAHGQLWDELTARPSTPDALDVALNLDGVFDANDDSPPATVQLAARVPVALSGDDQEPPAPEDLGRAWLLNATQSELGVSEADLAADLDNILPSGAQLDDLDEPLAEADDQDALDDQDSISEDDGPLSTDRLSQA